MGIAHYTKAIPHKLLPLNPHYKSLAVVADHYSVENFNMPLVQMSERSEFLNVILKFSEL